MAATTGGRPDTTAASAQPAGARAGDGAPGFPWPGRTCGWTTILAVVVVGAFGWPAVADRLGDVATADASSWTIALVGTLVLLPASFGAGLVATRRAGRAAAAWMCLAVGGGVLAIATAFAAVGAPADTGLVGRGGLSAAQLAASVVLLAGTLMLPSSVRWTAVSRIDVALVAVASLALMWLAPLRTEVGPQGSLTQVLERDPGAIVLVAMMVAAAVLLVRTTPGGQPGAWLMAIGLIALPAALYTSLVGMGDESGAAVTRSAELWWLVGPVLLLAAAARGAVSPGDPVAARHDDDRSGVATVAVVVTLASVAFHEQVMDSLDLVMMAMGVLAVLLAGARLGLLLERQSRLQHELQALAGELASQSRRDGLTGLGNRLALEERLADALGDPGPDGVSVFYMDVDRFKNVNDALGHKAGDVLLQVIAVRLTDVLGVDVYRIGGDEFVAVREDLDEERSEALAAAVVAALVPPIQIEGRPVTAATSIGLARSRPPAGRAEPGADGSAPADGDDGPLDADALLRRADLALYRAKELGRARSAVFDVWLQERADRRLALQQGLREAIDERALEVRFQPVVDLESRRVVAAEAQLRWETADHGVLLPEEFVPVAGEAGLVPAVVRLAIHDALNAVAGAHLDDGTPLELLIGLSGHEIAYNGLVGDVRELLGRTRVDPGRIHVELSERLVMDPAVEPTITGLIELGVGVTVQQFGTGSSSLRRLGRFPDPTIKVDRSFVAGLGRQSDDRLILEAVSELAAELGFTITADGVTREIQAQELLRLGAVRAQGWLFGPAVPWDEFVATHLRGVAEPVRGEMAR